MGFKHGKKCVDKNRAKCKMGFGRMNKNTPPTQFCAPPALQQGSCERPSYCHRNCHAHSSRRCNMGDLISRVLSQHLDEHSPSPRTARTKLCHGKLDHTKKWREINHLEPTVVVGGGHSKILIFDELVGGHFCPGPFADTPNGSFQSEPSSPKHPHLAYAARWWPKSVDVTKPARHHTAKTA